MRPEPADAPTREHLQQDNHREECRLSASAMSFRAGGASVVEVPPAVTWFRLMKLFPKRLEGREIAIDVRAANVGKYPEALGLNPRFHPDVSRLKLQLSIEWDPEVPEEAIRRLLGSLINLSPSLKNHSCQGPKEYQVQQPAAPLSEDEGASVEPELALVHLIEHVMIDVVAFVTGSRTVSGVTGAPEDLSRPFDLFVDCPDPAVARFATHLTLHWIVTLLDGQSLDGTGPSTLHLARLLYRHRPHAINSFAGAKKIGKDPDSVKRALDWLEEKGFGCRVNYHMNFSGASYYRLCQG